MGAVELLESTGAVFVTPGGQNEHPEAWGSVIKWGALNIGQEAAHDPDWTRMRQLMASVGATAFPWYHCRSLGDVDVLLNKANNWNVRIAGVNIEDVAGDGIDVPSVAAKLKKWGGAALIIVLPWLPNGRGWSSLVDYPFAIEYFPFDPDWNPIYNNRSVLAWHACSEIGDRAKLTFLYGTYPSEKATPAPYDLSVSHSLYTGDAVGITKKDWDEWRDQGTPKYVRCSNDNGGDMGDIGYQDGIKAMREWYEKFSKFIDQYNAWAAKQSSKPPKAPTIPLQGPAYDPNDKSTWPWPEKFFENTIRTLKDDHDASN